MSVIRVTGLKKNFQGNEIIKGLSFELERGKCIALLGPNGAGKTTTLGLLSGLLKPTAGSIHLEGTESGEDIRKYIGYLSQHPVFYEWMTGKEFLEYAGKLGGLTTQGAKERTGELLVLVGMEEAKNRRIGKYSGGMKQRLGIAQALIHRPSLLMLDEPVSALDPFGRREVLELMEKLKNETTILFSTHILNDAEEISDNILFLHFGEIVESGTMMELRDKYQQAKIDMVFRENTKEYIARLSRQDLIETVKMEGRSASLIVRDLEQAKTSFLKEIAEQNWPLVRFEVGKMNLEDLFVRVVRK